MNRAAAQRFACAAALLAFVGCTDDDGKQPSKPSAQPKTRPLPTRSPAADHMKEHFSRAVAIRDAIVRGDYEATREPAGWLAEHGAPEGIPDEWIEHVTELRVAAAGMHEAEDVAGVATALGPVLSVCGYCHADLKATLPYVVGSAPPGDDYQSQMQRHKWAMDRLWKGLVLPNEKAWRRGAEHIASVAVRPSEVGVDPELDKAQQRAIAALRTLGTKAVEAADAPARAAVYGALLSTCSGCHAVAK